MNYVQALVAILGGVYAVSYGRWLQRNSGNRSGAIVIFTIVALSIGLSVWQLFRH